MQTHEELTHFAGFDWAKDHHDVIIVDARGAITADFRIEHTPSGWKLWQKKTAACPRLGVAIETSFGAAVEQLLESGVTVYPVNPMNAKRYRERKCSSGNKTDRHDAWALADALRMDGHAWRPLGLQCMAGTAPVSYQSGKVHKVSLRRACNKNLRATMHLFADNSRAKCAWAKIYYNALRELGKSHAQALRCLGQRWLKIIWKMWQTSTCYDPDLHTRNQLAHGSWVLQINPQ